MVPVVVNNEKKTLLESLKCFCEIKSLLFFSPVYFKLNCCFSELKALFDLFFQFLKGQPVLGACCRTNVGGFHITDFLRQLLSLKYPYHM